MKLKPTYSINDINNLETFLQREMESRRSKLKVSLGTETKYIYIINDEVICKSDLFVNVNRLNSYEETIKIGAELSRSIQRKKRKDARNSAAGDLSSEI